MVEKWTKYCFVANRSSTASYVQIETHCAKQVRKRVIRKTGMIKCLGSIVPALPVCSSATGNVPEKTEKKCHLLRQEIMSRLTLRSVMPGSISFE